MQYSAIRPACSLLSDRLNSLLLSISRRHRLCRTVLSADHHHHRHPRRDGWFLISTANNSSTAPLQFRDVLSESNRHRCRRDLLDQDDPVDVNKIPWLRGRSVELMKPAAVLIPLCLVDDQPSVLFTLRSPHLPTHRGEVSFPGGKMDKNEKVVDTALREMEEEVGLKRDAVEVLGTMLPVPGKNYEFLVTPVVSYCGVIDMEKLALNHEEVSEVFTVSIESLCCERNIEYMTFRNEKMAFPVFVGHKHRIWGLTAVLLHNMLKVIAPDLYKPEIRLY